MLKILTIIALALFPVISFATESTEVKCNSGNDCFDKVLYLVGQKKDIEKSVKYAKKGCDQYNHGVCCLMSAMWTHKKQEGRLSDREVQELYAKPAELGVPGAIFLLYTRSPTFKDFASHIKNESMEEFYHSSNAVDKLLELNEAFLKVCTKQSMLKESFYSERDPIYFDLSKTIIIEATKDLKLKWAEDKTKFPNAAGVDMSATLFDGFDGMSDGDCGHLKKGLRLLSELKKYEDL